MSPEKLPPEPQRPSAKAAERLQVIVDAAERAALGVIDDAEKEAERYLEEAKARADRIAAERLRETAEELERRGGEGLDPGAPDPDPGPAMTGPASALSTTGSPFKAEAPPEREDDPSPILSEEASRPVEPLKVVSDPPADLDGPKVVPEPPARSTGKPGSAAARLLATQMAVSGASRKEIEMRLRSGFEIEDTGEILDAILGPED